MTEYDTNAESSIDEKREYVRIPKVQYETLMDVFLENEIRGEDIEQSPFALAVSDAYHDEADDRDLERIIEDVEEPVPTDDRSLDEIVSELGIEPVGRNTDDE